MKPIYALLLTLCTALVLSCGSDQSSGEQSSDEGMVDNTNTLENKDGVTGTRSNTTMVSTAKSAIRNISVEEFNRRRLASPDVVILDVRTPGETAEGMVPGAIQIDIEDKNFKANISKLDKSKEYLVYCAGGARSAEAAKLMAQFGFNNVSNLEGGYDEWITAEKEDK